MPPRTAARWNGAANADYSRANLLAEHHPPVGERLGDVQARDLLGAGEVGQRARNSTQLMPPQLTLVGPCGDVEDFDGPADAAKSNFAD